MKTLLIALAALLTMACVTPGDLQDLQNANVTFETKMLDAQAELAAGAITQEELNQRMSAAADERETEQERIALAASQRQLPSTGNGMIDLIVGLGSAAVGSYVAVNRARDNKRRIRGEPVKPVEKA